MSAVNDTLRRHSCSIGKRIAMLCLLLGGLLVGMQPAQAVQQLQNDPQRLVPLCDSPTEAVEIFQRAVSRGELMVFDTVIDSSMITPVRVEFVYEIGRSIPVVTVHSRLKTPMELPGNPEVEVRGVTAVLDSNGSIIETKAHAYTRQAADQ